MMVGRDNVKSNRTEMTIGQDKMTTEMMSDHSGMTSEQTVMTLCQDRMMVDRAETMAIQGEMMRD